MEGLAWLGYYERGEGIRRLARSGVARAWSMLAHIGGSSPVNLRNDQLSISVSLESASVAALERNGKDVQSLLA
jgi:hypothetical protein